MRDRHNISDIFVSHCKRCFSILLIWILSHGLVCAKVDKDNYSSLMKMSSRQLVDMGQRCAESSMRPDSALMCFTIVASRYSDKASHEEQRLAAVACIGKWYLYFFRYFDYAKAFESLSAARDISWKIKSEEARVLLNFGCMYQTLAEQNDNSDLNRKAYAYYRDAFYKGIKSNDKSSAFLAFSNLVTVAYSLDSLQSIEKEYNTYVRLKGDERLAYNTMFYRGLSCLNRGQYAEALQIFEEQKNTINHFNGYERFGYMSTLNQAHALVGLHRYAEAIARLKQLEHSAEASDMKDAKLEVYKSLADCYQKNNEGQGALLYLNKYYNLKDTLMNYQQVASVSELHFLNEMRQLDEQLSQMNRQQHIQNIVIIVALVLAVVFALFFLVIYKKNKLLKKKNQILYQRSLENIERSIEPVEPQRKYQNSTLDETEKTAIMQRVMHVMDTSDEILSPDFNIDRLAQLIDSKSKYVSQAINEKFGDNFNALINKYRIREACRRLNDREHYGQFTIDAISKSVGFRSRNTFTVSFRRFTGLTPSEYQRIAKEGLS